MRKSIKYLIISAGILFTACGGLDYTEEQKEVDQLEERLAGVKKTYQNIEVEKVAFAMETYKKNMEQIKMYYTPDSIDLNITQLMDFYKGVKKGAKGFEGDHKKVGEYIAFIENQLGLLEDDMNNNIDLKDSIDFYLQNETQNIEVLQKNLSTLAYNYDYVIKVHDSIASTMQSLLFVDAE